MSALALTADGPAIQSANEDDLQRGMAELARIYGWRPEREVVIPGWGRLDLVLHASERDDYAVVVEFKMSLVKASLIRKAFQQADGYYRWLQQSHGRNARVILSPIDMDEALVNEAAYAYRGSVELMYASQVMNLVTGPLAIEKRAARATIELNRITAEHALASDAQIRMRDMMNAGADK